MVLQCKLLLADSDRIWDQQSPVLLVKVLCPTQHKIGHFGDIPKPISWLGMEKQNLTQQKHTFTNQKKCTATQNKCNKLKPGLVASYNIRPGNGVGLFWFQCFINLSPTTLTHLLTGPDPHGAHSLICQCDSERDSILNSTVLCQHFTKWFDFPQFLTSESTSFQMHNADI